MKKALALLAVVWLLLLPPLFTDGECTHEFDAEHARIERERAQFSVGAKAAAYWNGRGIVPRVISVDQCRRAKPRDLQSCGSGPIVQAAVPVRNPVCNLYRDGEIRVRFFYDEFGRLGRTDVEMKPYFSLPLPGGVTLHWAR